MSNLDTAPVEQSCHRLDESAAVTKLLAARQVPLGGVRAMTVSRTLPTKEIPLVGAWCFFDQMGPERVQVQVLPHPHIGLQTVTWPLVGEIRHRDSLGSDVVLRPGELNLMTSGAGVAHSEFSLGGAESTVHGLQLWVALPSSVATSPARFEQHSALPVHQEKGFRATVFIGELGAAASPAVVHTPLLGADVTQDPGSNTALAVRRDFEHAVLVLDGQVTVAGVDLPPGPLLYLGSGRHNLPLVSATGARFILLGGEPFPDELVMWWNFVARSHDEIVQARADWEAHSDRFGPVAGHGTARMPAPPMPPIRLTPRRRAL